MLDPNKKKTYGEAKVISIIGQGTTISGEVRSTGTIRIEGMVSGKVQCDDTIIVNETGKVKADLLAAQVVISGEVQGNVAAHERLEVNATARVLGDITAPRIAIAEGVLFEGKCTMKAPGQAVSKPSDDVIPLDAARQAQQAAAAPRPQGPVAPGAAAGGSPPKNL